MRQDGVEAVCGFGRRKSLNTVLTTDPIGLARAAPSLAPPWTPAITTPENGVMGREGDAGADECSAATAKRHTPIVMRTLGDFQRSKGYIMGASCERCGRHKTLDLNSLAQRFGHNVPVDRLKPLLRCTSCGERGRLTVGYSIDPPPGR